MCPPLPPLVDSHCHLTWPDFRPDVEGVITRMREAGVAQAVVVATTPADAAATLDLCRGRPGLYPSVGLHPNDVPQSDAGAPGAALETALLAVRQRLASAGGAYCAVGETGLDYYREQVSRAAQARSFAAQLQLAREFGLPAIVHIRDREGRWEAYDDVAEQLEAVPGVRGVIHCYTGDPAHAERYLGAGFAISFSGILTFPKAENVRASARAVPLERLLVETDAPYLAPLPHRGQRNEPAYVAHTCAALAQLKGVGLAEARAATAANARALFGLPEPGDDGPRAFGRPGHG